MPCPYCGQVHSGYSCPPTTRPTTPSQNTQQRVERPIGPGPYYSTTTPPTGEVNQTDANAVNVPTVVPNRTVDSCTMNVLNPNITEYDCYHCKHYFRKGSVRYEQIFDPVWPTAPPYFINVLSYYFGCSKDTCVISQGIGRALHYSGGYCSNSGINSMDIAGYPNTRKIIAIEDGYVLETRPSDGLVIIDHGKGYSSLYMHLNSYEDGINSGARVTKGQEIGNMGGKTSTGHSTGPHLHFEILMDLELKEDKAGKGLNASDTVKKYGVVRPAWWEFYRIKYKKDITFGTAIVDGCINKHPAANDKTWRDWINHRYVKKDGIYQYNDYNNKDCKLFKYGIPQGVITIRVGSSNTSTPVGQYLALPIDNCTIIAMYKNDSSPAYEHEHNQEEHFGLDMISPIGPGMRHPFVYASGNGKVVSLGGTDTTGVGYWATVQYDKVYRWNMNNDATYIESSIVMRYYHLASKPNLTIGQNVGMGSVIGTIGHTGKEIGQPRDHLHIEVDTDTKNPLNTPTLIYEVDGLKKGTRGLGDTTFDPCSVLWIRNSTINKQKLTYLQRSCNRHTSYNEQYINTKKMEEFMTKTFK